MNPRSKRAVGLLLAVITHPALAHSQASPALQDFFLNDIGLTQQQIASIRNGEVVTKALPPRNSKEVFLFGGIYIHASQNDYLKYASDVERLRKMPSYLALGVISEPPKLSDFQGFSFDAEDITAIGNCRPGNCLIQLPGNSMQDFQKVIGQSPGDGAEQVNDLLHRKALERLSAYRSDGNSALGVYNDKHDPTEVARQFKFMLSYSKAFPKYLPQFYQYLLDYPNAKPPDTHEVFYWARVKFGLKPTLRVVHVLVQNITGPDAPGTVIAEKQLYSSHYFETALDLTFCIAEPIDNSPGFYLITVKGSEQEGLGGFKGTFVRNAATGRSTKALRESLIETKNALETHGNR